MPGHVVRMIPGFFEGVAMIAGFLVLYLWSSRDKKSRRYAVVLALLVAVSCAAVPWSRRFVRHEMPPLATTPHTVRRIVEVKLLPMSLVDPQLKGFYADEGIRHWATPRGTGYDDDVVQFVIASRKGPHTLVERFAPTDLVMAGVKPEDARYEVWQCTYDNPDVADEWGDCAPRVVKLYVPPDALHLHDGRFKNKPDVGRHDPMP